MQLFDLGFRGAGFTRFTPLKGLRYVRNHGVRRENDSLDRFLLLLTPTADHVRMHPYLPDSPASVSS